MTTNSNLEPSFPQALLPLGGVDIPTLAMEVFIAKDKEICSACGENKWHPINGEQKMIGLDKDRYFVCADCFTRLEDETIVECYICDEMILESESEKVDDEFSCTQCCNEASICDNCGKRVSDTVFVEEDGEVSVCDNCVVECDGCGENCLGDYSIGDKEVCMRCHESSPYIHLLISLGACHESIKDRRNYPEITIEKALEDVICWSRFEWLADRVGFYSTPHEQFEDSPENREWLIKAVNAAIEEM